MGMAASFVKILFGFLLASIILWLVFMFASRLLSWILSRLVGISVGFRIGGWMCLRDVVVKFKKGVVESVSVGEIRLSLRHSLVKVGVGFISRDSKLQVLICDLEVVLRPSDRSTQKRSQKGRTSGRRKWMVVANVARLLSASISVLVVKMPRATIAVKELRAGISKDGGSMPALFVKLHLLHILGCLGGPWVNYDQPSNFTHGGYTSPSPAFFALLEKNPAPFCCEELILSSEFGYDREGDVAIKNVGIISGEVTLNLNEELFLKKKSSSKAFSHATEVASSTAKESQTKQAAFLSLNKYISVIPEKLYFNLPKLEVKFVHRRHDLVVENTIVGIQVEIVKSRSIEDVRESACLDIRMDFSEIHLFREAGISFLEILKLLVVSSAYIPSQHALPIRYQTDIKLGDTQCNILMSRLKPWMHLHSSKKKKMVLHGGNSNPKRLRSIESKGIWWTCTVSAPEMTTVLYSLSCSPQYLGCSQSLHVFANNISSAGTSVHMELGELSLHMAGEFEECLKESLLGMETNTGCIMHIAPVSLDWGKKDMESLGNDGPDSKVVLSVEVTAVGVYLTFKRIESLVSMVMSIKYLLNSFSASSKKSQQNQGGGHPSESSGKGIQLVKFNFERCAVNFNGDVGLENTIVADPKRVNYGSQGGQVIVNLLADGTLRSATITSTLSEECKKLKYCLSLDIFQFSMSMNREKQSTQMELERARSIYQEYLDADRSGAICALFDMQNAKILLQCGTLKENGICYLLSATDITIRWEPDVHIALFELVLQVKLLIHNQKVQGLDEIHREDTSNLTGNEQMIETSVESVQYGKQKKKKESRFTVDIEMLSISAEVGDGVDAMVQVQSIFTENASIGVLLEGLVLSFNEARVLKSSRIQISRIPNVSAGLSDAKIGAATSWDWVIQGLDVHICMPYRLQLRAIDDSIEEMLRALKLITASKSELLFPMKKDGAKPKKPSSTKFGCVKFCIHKLTIDIEEEPFQGWLDEHFQLMKNEASELSVRLKFLDELISKGRQCSGTAETKDSTHADKILFSGGEEIDVRNASAIQKMEEEIYKRSFQSYYKACQNLMPSEGSGACKRGFQAGFKPSTSRPSLLSIYATELDVSLTRIVGGDDGMIEVIQKLDPVSREFNIPFSRLYGSTVLLRTCSLVVQLRNYTLPLFSASYGSCEGRILLAQQATCFQPQIHQNVFIGRWRKARMLRTATGTTPPMKTYLDLPIHFQKAEVAFGVGFEPVFADISYAFTVALRRANLSIRDPCTSVVQPPRKERSLPWWDDMRNYIHGNITLFMSETRWNLLATTDPYEKCDTLQIVSCQMEIQQSDGRVYVSVKDFQVLLSTLESLLNNCNVKLPDALLEAPSFTLEVTMEWECDSGNPMNHYLFALPNEGVPREKVFDPFRSTSLSLKWDLSLRPSLTSSENQSLSSTMGDDALRNGTMYGTISKSENVSIDSPTIIVGSHDLAWLIRFWNLNFIPPHKLRTFSRWPRFGIPRVARSGNLSLDRVMTEFMFRIDATPIRIRHMPLDDDDPAKGLTIKMSKLKCELFFSRGKQKYTFESKRDPLDLVYQGLDLHMPKANINKEDCMSVAKVIQIMRKSAKYVPMGKATNGKCSYPSGCTEKLSDDGFLLSSDYFAIRRQAANADPERLLAWQEAGRRNLEMTYIRSEFENESQCNDCKQSDLSDDDGYNVVIADNCQRIFVYGLKLLWTFENRDAVCSWVAVISKAFEPPKLSPSRLYAQKKLVEDKQVVNGPERPQDDLSNACSIHQAGNSPTQLAAPSGSLASRPPALNVENSPSGAVENNGCNHDSEEEGTRHFMVNIVEPQFNLHSEDSNGRFLLAADSGRVLARSFHSVLHVGYETIGQALGTGNVHVPEYQPEMTWNRMEFSVMLEHVQAHVAPTDVDPGAGLQWLPKIRRSSPTRKRTGALLERVFVPCDMYFRYTRHNGIMADLKMKPLKELSFNSRNLTAAMTSRQFQVMLDVLTNLLLAPLPKPRKTSLSYLAADDEGFEEEADEVVPDGVKEVELARINLEQKEQEQKLLLNDIRKLSSCSDSSGDVVVEKEGDLWMITGGRSTLVYMLNKELESAKILRKTASAALRMALEKATQLRLIEKERNKTPSCAMRVSLQVNKVIWSMLVDGKSFVEVEINDMKYDFDRDYKDFAVARFTTKYFVVRNCLPNAKFDTILSPWNPPPEWGKKVMLLVDATRGAPKDGKSPFENFQVEIYPLKIHLTDTLYHIMWGYFFPDDQEDYQGRQDVWKVSTAVGPKSVKKVSSLAEAFRSSSHSLKKLDVSSKPNPSLVPFISGTSHFSLQSDSSQTSKLQNTKDNVCCGSTPELRRTSSFDRTWEETVAESVANELVSQVHSSGISPSRSGSLALEQLDKHTDIKSKDMKPIRPGRTSHMAKKVGKTTNDKLSKPRKMRKFNNIKISQVELLVSYEGTPLSITELRLLMDAFHLVDFTGTWGRLFSRVKKHVIWGVLKSVTGMQGKKFKDKGHGQKESSGAGASDSDLNLGDSNPVQYPISWAKHPNVGSGDGFVTSIKGVFNSQRRKAKALVLRTMKGEADNKLDGEWSENDAEFSPLARQLTITKAKKLVKRHTKIFRSRGQKGTSSQRKELLPSSSSRQTTVYESDSSSSGSYEDFKE